ncbi:MAG: hypothetical protein ABGZ17_27350, partial [Planctomycetaceae bacterium]
MKQLWKARWFLPTLVGLVVGYGLGFVTIPEGLRAVWTAVVPADADAAAVADASHQPASGVDAH